MYPVSAAYKTAIGQNVRDIKITGTITLKDDTIINITDEDIVQGSLYVTEQCVAGEDIEVGNVYASEMGLSLSTPLENPYSLDGARVHIYFGIDVGSLWEYVPLGYFYVTEIQRKANNVNLTALDGMLLFDIPVGEPGSSSPRNFVVHACEQAGVTLGTSVFEIDTFANAGVLLAAPDASKIKTCRDLLMWACQLMGAFARMNRSGQLEIVPIKARTSVKTISKAERFNSDVSDFAVKITKVSMQVGETVYSRGTDGMTMVLEENPLMTGLSESQINAVLDNLLAQITTAVYVPFNSNFIGDPALQPGDFVTLADTSVLGGGDVASIITHSTWRYRGPHNIKGAGKHGLVRGVQNQQIKAVSSIVAIARAAQDLALAANQSTQLIKDAIGGHVLIRQNPDETNEILIMDNPDPDQAVKIWRWNMGGLGYSDNCVGADNPAREYDIAMTMDGAINASFVKTGQLDAGVVRVGPETTFAPGYDPVDNHVYFQYSADGATNWHDTFNPATDKYMRQKVGDSGTWSDPMRVVGEDGYTPIKGVDYFDGVDGQDGTSAYLWVRYSQNADGNPMTTDPTGAVYIGIATTTTPTAPTSHTAYQWSLIKGQDGVPGEKGADGKTSYLHIKYSDDGVNFTANNGEDVGAWIGTYVDFNPVDSMNFNDYTWNKVRGEDGYTPIKGVDYFDGVDGQDGTSAYLWVRYSQNSNGNPMTTDPTGAVYIGIATTTTPSAPTSYTAYSWSLIKGQDGVPGEKGADGQTSYLHIKYSDDGETFTPTWDWETEIENVTYSYVQSLHGTSWAAQGFKPTENLVGATTIKASLMSNGYNGVPPDTYWHVYTDNNGIPGVSISQNGFGTVLGVDWAKSFSWSTAEIKLSEPLQEGQQYWLVVMSENGDSSNRAKALYSGSDVYTDGYRCTSTTKGATWSKSLDRDLTFRIKGYNITSYDGETPGAYIGTYVDFNPVDSMNFNDYTWNKVKGTPIVWKGDLASPPSNPEENWVYRDTDNGRVYIYNGTAWELMVTDGADGIDGAPGADGMSVYITYHNNPTDSPPATPTGDGTSGGWYTAPSAQANWMSQKVATNAYSGTWGAPILISGGRKFTSQPVPPYDVGDLWIGGSDGQNTLICTTARSSGSFVASDWERMTEPVANMGVDSDCTGLWHFDGSLNSHKGVSATFTRASVAYLSDGTQVPAGQPRFEPGKFGRGVLIEEGTTNRVTNGNFTNGVTGWIANQDATLSVVTEDGRKFCRVVSNQSTSTPGLRNAGTIAVSPNTTYTVSCLGYSSADCNVRFYVFTGASQTIDVGTEYLPKNSAGKISLTFTTDANTTSVIICILMSPGVLNAWFKVTDIQLEEKPYTTSFVDGTRAAEDLTIPRSSVLPSLNAFTIAFRAYPSLTKIGLAQIAGTTWARTGFLEIGNYYTANESNVMIWKNNPDGPNAIKVSVINNLIEIYSPKITLTQTEWAEGPMIVLRYDGSRMYLDTFTSVGHEQVSVEASITHPVADLIRIGRAGGQYINGIIDELRIDKVCRTDEEIQAWYKANAPFYTSEDMKQWPGYMKLETDGLKVYDPNDALRVLLGSWLKGAIRKYGLKIIGGEIYSTMIQTGEEGSDSYIYIGPVYDNYDYPFMIKLDGKDVFNIMSRDRGPILSLYDPYYNERVATILPMDDDRGQGLRIRALNNSGEASDLHLDGRWITVTPRGQFYVDAGGNIGIFAPIIELGGTTRVTVTGGEVAITCPNGVDITGGLRVFGTPKNAVEYTEYGDLEISAVECPEVRYIYSDIGILTNGECRIDIDPMFLACIEPNTEHSKWVFDVTPHGKAMLYIDEIGEDYFVVKDYHEVADGVEFSWTLSAVRKDFAHRKFMEVIPKNVVESRIARRTPEGK